MSCIDPFDPGPRRAAGVREHLKLATTCVAAAPAVVDADLDGKIDSGPGMPRSADVDLDRPRVPPRGDE